jgi:hypothetical protein
MTQKSTTHVLKFLTPLKPSVEKIMNCSWVQGNISLLLVSLNHSSMAVHLTRRTVEGFWKCCISIAVERTDDDVLWSDSEEDGDVRSECEEDEGIDCEGGDSDTDW